MTPAATSIRDFFQRYSLFKLLFLSILHAIRACAREAAKSIADIRLSQRLDAIFRDCRTR